MANVVFLWHMHQPYYVDPTTRTATMPWVRLHSVKGYLDMVTVIEEFPGIRVNFNLTPVLVLQIKELIEGQISDLWLDLSRRPAADLDDRERFAILENFFKIHWDNLVKPFPRYWELLNKRGLTFYRDEVRRGLRYFSTQELLDLQTWFNLAWCGYTAERLYPELAELKRKGRGFTEEEKNRVLDIHLEIMRLVIQKYAAAEERGQSELTTTPFFHPILPLIYDTALAERSLPGRSFPKRFTWPEDAAAHLTLAVEQHAAIFGKAPRGLWPSEGSIAPELIPLIQQCGIEYFCSDEENLFNSLRQEPSLANGPIDHLELFQGWKVRHDDFAVNALFREKPLSDFIGFMAARNSSQDAANHLLHHLRNISKLIPSSTGVIPLVLDGENAWETFADGGESFLRALYGGIQADEKLHSCTIEDFFRNHPPTRSINRLHTGSWISANFDIWIGEDEENRAWNLLGETRQYLQGKIDGGVLTPEAQCAALREIYAAEGSDWFWWYGPDFTTENDALFDALFRQHLKNVYSLCGDLPPAILDQPITGTHSAPPYTHPQQPISPNINGSPETFFEWNGAGVYVSGAEQGAMYRADRFIDRIWFGNDDSAFYLRFDMHKWDRISLQIHFQSPTALQIETDELHREGLQTYTLTRADEAPTMRPHFAARETVEMAISFEDLGMTVPGPVSFQVKLFLDGIERERYPESVPFQFPLSGEEFALQNWIV